MAAKKTKAGSARDKSKDSATKSLPYEARVSRRTEDNLTATQKAFRRRFVMRYLKCGVLRDALWGLKPDLSRAAASTQASELWREDYTQQVFREELAKLEESELEERKLVKFMLFREANHVGGDASHSGRVSALSKLTKILGMEIEKEHSPKNPPPGVGGVMLVPLAGNLEEWTRAATVSQQNLKQEVRK